MRRLLLTLAIITVPLAGLLAISYMVVTRSAWVHQRTQEMVARHLADMVGREVRVGPVRGNLVTEVEVEGIAIAADRSLSDGAVLTARRVRVSYDLRAILRREKAPAAAVRQVHVEGLEAYLVRDAEGRVNLQQLLPPPKVIPPPEDQFQGQVWLHDARIHYTDHGAEFGAAPLRLELDDVSGHVDLRKLGWVRAELAAVAADDQFAAITVGGVFQTTNGGFSLNLELADLDLARTQYRLWPSRDLQIDSGRAQVRASVYRVPTDAEEDTGYCVRADLEPTSVTIADLPGGPVRVGGALTVTPQGIVTDGMRLVWNGQDLHLAGSVVDFEHPIVDLQVQARGLDLARVLQALPAEATAALPPLSVAGPVSLKARLVGPPQHAALDVRVIAPGAIAVEPNEELRLSGKGLDLTVALLDLSDPVLVGRLDVATVQPGPIPLGQAEDDQWPRFLTVSELGNVSAQFQWTADMPVIQSRFTMENLQVSESQAISVSPANTIAVDAQLSASTPAIHSAVAFDSVRLWDVELSDVTAEAALVGTALHLRDVRADVLGGRLAAEAVVDLSQERPAIYSDGTVRGVELVRLPVERLGLKSLPSGRVDAAFALTSSNGHLTSAASLSGDGLAYETFQASRAGALLTLEDDKLEVLTAFATAPMATVWARGSLASLRQPSEAELAVDFQVAEAHLDALLQKFDVEQAGGVLYVQGQVSGTPSRPNVGAEATVFQPRYQQYRLDALTADFTTDLEDVNVSQMLASRGSAAVAASGSLSGVSALRDSMADAETRIAGRFEGAGIQLAEVSEMLGLEWNNVDGLAEMEGVFGGTVQDPIAAGHVQIAHAMTSTLDIAEGRIPFELTGRILSIEDAVFQVQGSELRAQAEVDLGDEPWLTASLSAADVYLEGIYQLQGMGLEVGGLVQIPVARVQGPFDNLTGQALLVSDLVVLDDQPLEHFQAELALSKDLVKLLHMRCELADGEAAAVGSYNMATEQMEADITMTEVGLSKLLSVARPAVAAVTDRQDRDKQEGLLRTLDSMSLRLDGRCWAELHVEGNTAKPVAKAQVQLREAVFDQVNLPDVLATARADRQGLYDIILEATQGEALITAEGDLEFDGEVDLLIIGSGVELAGYDRWTPLRAGMSGELGFTIVAGGNTRKPQIKASVDVLKPQVAGIGFDLLSAPIISLEEGGLAVDSLTLRRSYENGAEVVAETEVGEAAEPPSTRTEEELVVDGTLPFSWEPVGIVGEQPMALEARIEDADLALFPILLNEFAQYQARRDGTDAPDTWARLALDGSVDSVVRVGGTPARPALFGFLQVQGGSMALDAQKKLLTDVNLDLELHGETQGNTIVIKQGDATWDNLQLALTGSTRVIQTAPEKLAENDYDLALTVTADRQQFARGLTAWEVGGKVTLKGGRQTTPELRVERLGGKFGKGRIALDGTAQMADFRLANLAHNKMEMELAAEGAEVALRGVVEGVLDGNIAISGSGEGTPALVSGGYSLSHGRLGLPAGGGEPQELHAPGASYPKPRFDLRLALGPDMQLVGPGIVAPLQPTGRAAHVHGTLQSPVIEGIVEAQRGRTQVPGGVATIKMFRVQYKLARKLEAVRRDPVALELTGEIRGEAETVIRSAALHGRDIGSVMIEMKLSGQLPDQFRVDVSSHPPLQESQIYAMLGAQPFAYLAGGGTGTGLELEQILSEQFLGALAAGFRVAVFEPLEQELRRLLGLSEFSVNFAFNQPVEVKLGKYVLEDLLVTYRTALGTGDDGYDIAVAYEVGQDWRVSYNSDHTGRHRLQVERVWSF